LQVVLNADVVVSISYESIFSESIFELCNNSKTVIMSYNSFQLQLSHVVRSPVKCRMRKFATGEVQQNQNRLGLWLLIV